MYHDLGPTTANTIVGFLSAVVDNIPVMFAVLTMDPVIILGYGASIACHLLLNAELM